MIDLYKFDAFPKIKRLFRDVVVTEKIDGTNASVTITEDGQMLAGSRNKFITTADDNYGFARWVEENEDELYNLGTGRHFGEWWGKGIQRNYGSPEKQFSLFNTDKWSADETRPRCCGVVPVLYKGIFSEHYIRQALFDLKKNGSRVSPGFMNVEGVCVFHTHANILLKYTVDDNHKENIEDPSTL